jgi:hypothetical protein
MGRFAAAMAVAAAAILRHRAPAGTWLAVSAIKVPVTQPAAAHLGHSQQV